MWFLTEHRLQLRQMEGHSLPLDAQRGCGLGSDTTLDVSLLADDYRGSNSSFRPAMRRVLHLKMVTQCAMLEDFGMFLVLADKVGLFPIIATQKLIEGTCIGLIRLSHRSACPIVPAKCAYVADPSTSQWHAGRPFLQRR